MTTTTETAPSSSSPSSSSSSTSWGIAPPILSKIDCLGRYPNLVDKKMMLYDYPGGAIIESDMMRMMRWTCSAALFFITPLDWHQSRRRILKEAEKSSVRILPRIQRNMALGTVCGALMGGVESLARHWRLTEQQVVERAVHLRSDLEHDRWSRTTARCATAAVLPMIIYTSGSLPMRVLCGMGLGVVVSVPVSATKLDFSFYYALSANMRQVL